LRDGCMGRCRSFDAPRKEGEAIPPPFPPTGSDAPVGDVPPQAMEKMAKMEKKIKKAKKDKKEKKEKKASARARGERRLLSPAG
jgi:hypothetical protein